MEQFWRFARMMLRYRRLLALALAGLVVDALCAAGGFGALMWVIDHIAEPGSTMRQIVERKLSQPWVTSTVGDLSGAAQLIPAGRFAGFAFVLVLIFALAAVGSLGRFTHAYCSITIALRTVMRIRRWLFMRLLHLPMVTVSSHGTSDNMSRIVRDTQGLARGFNGLMSRALREITMGLVFLTCALVISWRLAGLFIIGFPLIVVLIRKFGKRIRRATRRALNEYGRMVEALVESLQAMAVVKVHHTEGYERRRFNRINRRVFDEQMDARLARALSAPVIELMAMAGVMVVALAAVWMIANLTVEPRSLVKVGVALAAAGGAMRPLAGLHNNIQQSAAAAQRIHEALQLPAESSARQELASDLRRLPRHRESIAFDGVTFTYPGAEAPALRDIDLTVPHGHVCALVGGNGSGKSTLVGLLPRLYDPTEGRVLIDGVDTRQCTLRSVRRQMAMVTQETVLFDGTIAENLTYGARQVSRDRMVEAAKQAHAHEFIERMPDGYDTPVGERGQRLSGGQRQRIAIARAILRDPAILILDEATSQIDAESEARIHEALADLMADRTTFVIAHRLSTVVDADMIVVLDEGVIASVGTHQQLLESSDTYRVLCRTQLQGLPAGSGA